MMPAAVVSRGFAPDATLPPVSDYDVWYDANDPRRLLVDGSNGLAAWMDRGASQAHAVQQTAASRATYGVRSWEGKNAPDFDGGDAYGTTYTESARPHSGIAAVHLDNVTGTNRFVYSGLGGNNRIGLFVTQTTGILGTNFANIANHNSAFTVTTGVPHVIGHSLGASAILHQYDANQASTGGSDTSAAGALAIGQFSAGTSMWDGMIAELLIWDRELTAQEMADMASYLMTKWGI